MDTLRWALRNRALDAKSTLSVDQVGNQKDWYIGAHVSRGAPNVTALQVFAVQASRARALTHARTHARTRRRYVYTHARTHARTPVSAAGSAFRGYDRWQVGSARACSSCRYV